MRKQPHLRMLLYRLAISTGTAQPAISQALHTSTTGNLTGTAQPGNLTGTAQPGNLTGTGTAQPSNLTGTATWQSHRDCTT